MTDAAPRRYVGCDLSIYADGGFLDDPAILERMRAEHAEAPPRIRTEAILYPPAAYERPLRRDRIHGTPPFVAGIEAMAAQTRDFYPRGPAVALVRIADALIVDRAVYQLHEGAARPIYEMQRPCDRPYLQWTDATLTPEALPDDRDYFLLTSSGTFNWGHWLIEDLTRLAGIRRLAAAGGRRLTVLFHAFLPDVDVQRMAALQALLGADAKVDLRMISPAAVFRAPLLWYVTPVSVHPGLKNPHALADLADAGARLVRPAEKRRWLRPWRRPSGRKLFVTRRPERGRAPANLAALHDLATARGFTLFDTEGASASEQIAAFAAADRVAGIMGAAMAATAFCPARARLLYFAPESFPEPFYWDLAAARGQDYAVCYGTSVDPDGPNADYAIDLATATRAFDALL